MIIESIFPQVVGTKSSLVEQLMNDEFIKHEMSVGNDILSFIPSPLIESEAFLDKMTNLWRYEFGVPYQLDGSLLWGTDMWVPIQNFIPALKAMNLRLNEEQRALYLERLNVPEKHLDVLVEMIPGYKINAGVSAKFEVVGYGNGNKTIDWLIEPLEGKSVLIDVKRRMADLIHNMDNPDVLPKEEHDHSLLFRSIEKKFNSTNSEEQLQGAWIVTNIKQNYDKLVSAFDDLDPTKVHFAVLGDWRDDVLVLSRSESDKGYISNIFGVSSSTRYIMR